MEDKRFPAYENSGVGSEPPSGAPRRKGRLLFAFTVVVVLFWGTEFFLQYVWLTEGELVGSLLRSFALTGATLVSCSLLASVLFKWIPRWAKYWRVRRYLGVSGFVCIVFHALAAYSLFRFDLRSVYFSFNPFENPIVFGSIAFPILLAMALTSSDWAMRTVGPKRWKLIHRFVYLAYWGIVFHVLLSANLNVLRNPPIGLLLVLMAATLFGELYWAVKISAVKKFRTRGAFVAVVILVLYVITAVFWYSNVIG